MEVYIVKSKIFPFLKQSLPIFSYKHLATLRWDKYTRVFRPSHYFAQTMCHQSGNYSIHFRPLPPHIGALTAQPRIGDG